MSGPGFKPIGSTSETNDDKNFDEFYVDVSHILIKQVNKMKIF